MIKTQTNKHTGWKHYHLANAGDKKCYITGLCGFDRESSLLLYGHADIIKVESYIAGINSDSPELSTDTVLCVVSAAVIQTFLFHLNGYLGPNLWDHNDRLFSC